MNDSNQLATLVNRSNYFVIICLQFAVLFSANAAFAAEVKVGEFQAKATVVNIAGKEWAGKFENMIAPETEIEWDIIIPKNYKADTPPGVLVYISPGKSGQIPRKWKLVLEEQNLIWIAANRSGNRVDPRLRVAYAILGPVFLREKYQIDFERVYVAGLSGGGRVASIVAPEYASLFKGAIYICGANLWEGKTPEKLEIAKSNRFVFLTGDQDFNRRDTKRVFNSYGNIGLENALYLQIRGMGHENPDARGLAKAINYLDND